MAQDRRTLYVLAALLPAGALGLSISLAAADAAATSAADNALQENAKSVSLRLEAIRESVSVVVRLPSNDGQDVEQTAAETKLAWWGNGGWRNGFRNGGFRNW